MKTPYWTAFSVSRICGSTNGGPHSIAPLAPVHVIGGQIIRCADHSAVPVDWAQVDKARHAIEVSRLVSADPPASASPVTRYRQSKPLLPFEQVADLPNNPRAAAAGDRD
jgi:hypothetical protein